MGYAELKEIGLFSLDTTPVFDRTVALARRLLDCKTSLLSLIDKGNDRQFFKAEAGLSGPYAAKRETPLSHSFCKTVVSEGVPLIVSDARSDVRFQNFPAVHENGVTAYLGVPVKDETDSTIAALCVIDSEPHEWTSEDVEILQSLGDGITSQIKLMLVSQKTEVSRSGEYGDDIESFVILDSLLGTVFSYIQGSDGQEEITIMSGSSLPLWELDCDDFENAHQSVFAMCLPEDLPDIRVSLGNSAARLLPWLHQWMIETPSGERKRLCGYGEPELQDNGSIRWDIIVRDITNFKRPFLG